MKIYPFLFFFFLCAFSSCELDETAESSPQIFLPEGSIRTERGDTIRITKNQKADWNEYYLNDTLYVDSVLYFFPKIYSGSGDLTGFYVSLSNSDAVELVWNRDSIDANILVDSSDYSTGVFSLPGTERLLSFPFRLAPLSEDKEFRLTFKVSSNASERFSEYNLILSIPIKENE